MRGSIALASATTSMVSSVEALSIRMASQLRAVFIAISESSVPRNWSARLRVQMTIDRAGLPELMHQPRDLIDGVDEPPVLRAVGPRLVERGGLPVQRVEQQVPHAQQAAQDMGVQPVGDDHRSLAEKL